MLFLRYGRDAERQADDLGFRYALEQGYDVREMPNVFAALQQSARLAYGDDPRKGYFEANRFLHPELVFRLDFPRDWRTQNFAQTEQTQLADVATFVSLEGRTYRILAYSPAPQFAGYESTFRAVGSSFARLTDAGALARQPQRLTVMSVPRAMTLTEFNTANPSPIPLEELALINQLAGPQAIMPARFRAKRVVGQ